jgi:cellulose synthase/poly-beta-1,6-N-acetylglucosamine synthase-like glycosyltransferase/beta-mannanase
MSRNKFIKPPSVKEKVTLRIMILLGLLCFANFFYWFVDLDLIDNKFLFYILLISIAYDTLKVIYIWYHYWDISAPTIPKVSSNFTVDVLTTYFPGEPYEMIKETLLAIQSIKYPHTTYLCDEANDPYLKNFCAENNIIHVTRSNRIDAKAGNINNALKQAKGDICLILDPDHVPNENFLEEIIPYFNDESIGFVQTIQAYYNVEESAVAKGAAEQTFHFYGPVMMTMNSYGTVNAIGANCVFRRKALDSIGGHAAGLSEDMHTAMQLHAKGWKSIYVPKVYTKGLVPASLTAYYKQQLKWSRGTLELLVAVYPKLFKHFSWRKKIHYGVLPFHYLSGISYLISFLIPIFSLFFATTPWKGNVLNFGVVVTPVLISILGIRFYVQRWVMQKSERGIHLTGGLLQTCTWWIYNIGLIYTIIRKKVPYLPTPKEGTDKTSWKILWPNLVVGIISIMAVIYGISIDFTPFSIFMSGFAILNASFMFYTLFFAFQKHNSNVLIRTEIDVKSSIYSRIQNLIFQIWRKAALPIIVLVFIISVVIQRDIEYGKWLGVKPEKQNKFTINYLGVFAPQLDNGISSLRNVRKMSDQIDEKFDIISFYVPWDKNNELNLSHELLDSIYNQNSIPMITWEPWLNTFNDIPDKQKDLYSLINEGYFDSFISNFSIRLKNLNRPVFLRFAHEFDNPFYPWSLNGEDAPAKFKKAWIHVYEIFKRNEAENVIWIWNPRKSENVSAFYPGKEYVDWIGVNILNYGKLNQDEKWHDFKELYEPFHDEFKNLPLTPVIITEFGTLKNGERQEEWLAKAFESIESEFEEIKSVIYFNSKVDNNWPKGLQMNAELDWTIDKNQVIKNSFNNKDVPKYVFEPLPELKFKPTYTSPFPESFLTNIKGINIKKGHDWRKDYHVLSRRNLLSDFRKIKDLGLNTIKFEGNSIYDYNLLKIANDFQFNVSYGFWIPADLDFVKDTLKTSDLAANILEEIKKRKYERNITSWNLQNDVQYFQKDFYIKPRIFYQNRAFLIWLSKLVKEIKTIDPSRPLIVDIEVNRHSVSNAKNLWKNIYGIDYIGLIAKNDRYLKSVTDLFEKSKIKYLYSEIGVPLIRKPLPGEVQTSFFVTAWQDTHQSNKLTFNGIVDRKGRFKKDYFQLQNLLLNTNNSIRVPQVKILKPATLIFDHMTLEYYAMVYDSISGWKYGSELKGSDFEWSLIKCDQYGNYLAIKDIGTGPGLSLGIPQDHEFYRLLLTTTTGKCITTTITNLNTPLFDEKLINPDQ